MVAYIFNCVCAVITAGLLGSGNPPGDDDPWYRVFSHPLLREVFQEVYEGSQKFAEAMDGMGGGFPLRIGVIDELEERNKSLPRRERTRIDPSLGAAAAYNRDPKGNATGGAVYFDIDRLHALSRGQPGMPVDSVRAREAVRDAMIHELYGHVAPVASEGKHVTDPRPRDPYQKSAIGQRENEIRAELGLPPRTRYGLFD